MAKNILNLLFDSNPWWQEKEFEFAQVASWPKRDVYNQLIEELDLKQITALLGLRRVGKTTLLKQAINSLVKETPEKKRIMFFSFEESFIEHTRDVLEEILYLYIEDVLRKKIWQIDEKVYIFLDEIQYIPFWQDILKRFYDQNPNFKFVISGSFSLLIRRGGRESLAGRIFEIVVPVLSFSEFLRLKGEKVQLINATLEEFFDLKEDTANNIKDQIITYGDILRSLFYEYLVKGQFPETINLPLDKTREYIRASILEKILEKDIPQIFKVIKTQELKTIFSALCKESGTLFSITSWASEAGLSLETLSNFFSYFDQSFLASLVYNYQGSSRKHFRMLKKIFVASPNLTSAYLGASPANPLFGNLIGQLVETAVYNRLKVQFQDINFFRFREKEVDFVIRTEEGIIPLEIKAREVARSQDVKNLIYFAKKKHLKKAFLGCLKEIGREKIDAVEIVKIPLYFLA